MKTTLLVLLAVICLSQTRMILPREVIKSDNDFQLPIVPEDLLPLMKEFAEVSNIFKDFILGIRDGFWQSMQYDI